MLASSFRTISFLYCQASFFRKIGKSLLRFQWPANTLLDNEINHLKEHQNAVMVVLKVHLQWMYRVVTRHPNYIECLLHMRIKPGSDKLFYIGIYVLSASSQMNQKLLEAKS